jgi:hypothetical protein
MGAITRGLRLARVSWSVVAQERQLLWLPIISMAASLVIVAVFGAGIWGIGLPDENDVGLEYYLVGFVLYVMLSFVSFFFSAAVIAAATEKMDGRPASVSSGLRIAWAHAGEIFVWSLINATVGMVLRAIQERLGLLGRLLGGLLGVLWSVITFFVVPVMLFEDATAVSAVKRSASLFRQRWGEQFIGNGAIGIAFFLAGVVVALPLVLLAAAVPPIGIPIAILAMLALMAAGAACSGVFNAALYRYAIGGEAAGVFSREDLDAAFRPKRGQIDTRPPMPPRPDGL